MSCQLRISLILCLALLNVSALTGGAQTLGLPSMTTLEAQPATPFGPDRSKRYIVQLVEAPLATYTGAVPGLEATAVDGHSGIAAVDSKHRRGCFGSLGSAAG